jgi:hypothetical protein
MRAVGLGLRLALRVMMMVMMRRLVTATATSAWRLVCNGSNATKAELDR